VAEESIPIAAFLPRRCMRWGLACHHVQTDTAIDKMVTKNAIATPRRISVCDHPTCDSRLRLVVYAVLGDGRPITEPLATRMHHFERWT